MGLRFFLLVNKQGQTRVAQYYQYKDVETRATLEAEIIRKCLARTERQVNCCFGRVWFKLNVRTHSLGPLGFRFGLPPLQCSFMEYRGFKLIFRRYASLYFIVGADNDEVSD